MRVTVLMENTAPEGLLCEHGLSLVIEHEGHSILLDAGSSAALLDNAARLGVDLSRVDAAVLSHGTTTTPAASAPFSSATPPRPSICGRRPRSPAMSCGATPENIWACPRSSSPTERGFTMSRRAPSFFPASGSCPTIRRAWRRGERVHMYRQTGSGLSPDDFAHEQSLVFVTTSGLILFSSCSHAGADTVTEEAMAAFPGLPVRAFLGGFHLMGASGAASLGVPPEEAAALGRRLLELGIGEIWTGHCTGTPAFELMRPVLGERLHALSTGSVVEL